MKQKHKNTLDAIFANPVRANVNWDDVIALLKALNAKVVEREGSRVAIVLNGVRGHFHRPHPQKETDKGALKSMRRFLSEAGYDPETRQDNEQNETE